MNFLDIIMRFIQRRRRRRLQMHMQSLADYIAHYNAPRVYMNNECDTRFQ
jgi:hypothetical protein